MKSLKKLLISTLLIASTISLTSCKWIRQIMSILNDDYSEEASRPEPSSHDKIEQVVGKDGGVVRDDADCVKISIPAGALSSDTNISVQYVEEPATISNNVQTGFLGAATFGPSGTTFAKPVEVSLELVGEPTSSSLAVFCYNENEKLWEYVTDATVQYGSIATFSITHFSSYQVANRTSDFYNEYQNIVRHAKANGLSDAEIIEEFRDYLVNYKHIMDYYEKFDGYWYEPCGLKLSGQYQINGEQNDPNHSFISEGESNKVGDTYGMSIVDGATSSKNEVKNASSSSEYYDVVVIVEYKLIKPDIELTASKKKLKKGESATISIRCHYTNVANFFDEFKDLELSNYMLTIAKPTHFSTDKSAVLTNGSGRASFTVTALENNKAETITVNFDVSGPFGVHAEGNITLNSEGIAISGHISEEMDIVWRAPTETMQGSWSVTSNGTFNLKVEYDFDGVLKQEEDKPLTGSLQFTNVVATFTSSPCSVFGTVDEASGTGTYDFFKASTSTIPASPSYDVVGTESDDTCSLYNDGGYDEIVTVSGPGNTHVYVVVGGVVGDEDDYDNTYSLIVRNSDSLLLGFALKQGTETYTSMTFKDKFSILFAAEGQSMEFNTLEEMNMVVVSQTLKTTQTITVE